MRNASNQPINNQGRLITRRSLLWGLGIVGGATAALGPENVYRLITSPIRSAAEILGRLTAGVTRNSGATQLSREFINFWSSNLPGLILGRGGGAFGSLSPKREGGFLYEVGVVAKSRILSEVPEIRDRLGLFFENPDEEYLIFRPNIEDTIRRQVADEDQRNSLLSILQQSQVGNTPKAFVERTLERDTVSEGAGYFMKILINAALATTSPADRAAYQQKFNQLLAGVLASLNENGLMSWRMEYHEADEREAGFRPVSLTDRHSASDADIYIAWALIWADALVQKRIWQAAPAALVGPYGDIPEYASGFYREKAKEMISRIKALDIVEKNGRKILSVSDGWGHADVLQGKITVNPSYIVLAALRDFAEFDLGDKRFWLEVRRDNFEVLEAAVSFSQELYQNIAEPQQRVEHALTVEHKGSTYYVLDFAYRDLIVNLLQRGGKELTDFGIEGLLSPRERVEANNRRYNDLAHNEIVSQQVMGMLLIRADVLDSRFNSAGSLDIVGQVVRAPGVIQTIEQALGAHPVPFVPDQLEVVVEKDGTMRVRVELGEGNLPHTENYDGIRGPKELGEELLLNNDTADGTVPEDLRITARVRTLLQSLIGGKSAAEVRVGRDKNLVPLACYLMGAVGSGNADIIRDFEGGRRTSRAGFHHYARANNGRGIFDPLDTGTTGEQPLRYYSTALAQLTLTALLAHEQLGAMPEDARPVILAYDENQRIEPASVPNDPLRDEPPVPDQYSGNSEIDAMLTYAVDFASNDVLLRELSGDDQEPHYPEIARRIYNRAHEQVAIYPNNPEVLYVAAASSRNVGLYRQAAAEFYRTLLNVRFATDPMVVIATVKNIVVTLSTLNYGFRVIADIFESMLESDLLLDQGARLAVMAAAVKLFKSGGMQVKAYKLAVKFLEEYETYSQREIEQTSRLGRLLRRAYNYLQRTATPRQVMLTEVVTDLMELLMGYGRVEEVTSVYEEVNERGESTGSRTSQFRTLRLNRELPQQVAAIIINGVEPEGNGEILDLLQRISRLRREIPVIYHSRVHFAEAKVRMRLVNHLQSEHLRLKCLAVGVGRLASPDAFVAPFIREAYELAEQAEEKLLVALEHELDGERDVFILAEMLNAFVDIVSFTSDKVLKTLKFERINELVEHRDVAAAGTRPCEFDYIRRANEGFRQSILANKVIQAALQNLEIWDYAVVRGMSRPEIAQVALENEGEVTVTRTNEAGEPIGVGMPYQLYLQSDLDALAGAERLLNTTEIQEQLGEDSSLSTKTRIRKAIHQIASTLSDEVKREIGIFGNDHWTVLFGPKSIQQLREELTLCANDAEKIDQIERLVQSYHGQFYRVMEAIGKAARRIAKFNPSVDPRNVLTIMFMLRRSDVDLAWAETPSAKDRFLGCCDDKANPSQEQADLERRAKLEAARMICDQVPSLYLSNKEHRMSLTIKAIIKSTLSLHKLREMERTAAAQRSQRWVSAETVARNEVLRIFGDEDTSWRRFFINPDEEDLRFKPNIEEAIRSQVSANEHREALLRLLHETEEEFLSSSTLFRARFKAMLNIELGTVSRSLVVRFLPEIRDKLGDFFVNPSQEELLFKPREDVEREIRALIVPRDTTRQALVQRSLSLLLRQAAGEFENHEDPIVGLFLDGHGRPNRENRQLAERVFQRFPEELARAWASLGNASWWGTEDSLNFATAVRYYEKALQYDPYCIDALRGWLQIHLDKSYNDALEVSPARLRQLRFRYFRRALERIQRGGVEQAVVDDVLGLPASFAGEDALTVALRNSRGANDQRVLAMLGYLHFYGY